jgi:riboflavin synthase
MFTGIIEETGVVQRIKATRNSIRLILDARSCARGIKAGDSLAVNGCCLTVVNIGRRGPRKSLEFDLLRETWLDGHFVTGHVDGLGEIVGWERAGHDHVLDIAAPMDLMRYIVPKGSIAVEGISLTIAAVRAKSFRVWIIPHTLEVTALRQRKRGDAVNLETDLLGKYVEKFARLLRR